MKIKNIFHEPNECLQQHLSQEQKDWSNQMTVYGWMGIAWMYDSAKGQTFLPMLNRNNEGITSQESYKRNTLQPHLYVGGEWSYKKTGSWAGAVWGWGSQLVASCFSEYRVLVLCDKRCATKWWNSSIKPLSTVKSQMYKRLLTSFGVCILPFTNNHLSKLNIYIMNSNQYFI